MAYFSAAADGSYVFAGAVGVVEELFASGAVLVDADFVALSLFDESDLELPQPDKPIQLPINTIDNSENNLFFITFSLLSLSPVISSESFRPSAVGRDLSVVYDPPGIALQKVICIFKPAISGQVISHFFHMGCSYIGSVGIARHTGDQIILKQYLCALSDSVAKSAQDASLIHLRIAS